MTSILVIIGRTYHFQIKCNYLKNQIRFAAFFIAFLESTINFELFLKLLTPKDLVTETRKRSKTLRKSTC